MLLVIMLRVIKRNNYVCTWLRVVCIFGKPNFFMLMFWYECSNIVRDSLTLLMHFIQLLWKRIEKVATSQCDVALVSLAILWGTTFTITISSGSIPWIERFVEFTQLSTPSRSHNWLHTNCIFNELWQIAWLPFFCHITQLIDTCRKYNNYMF